VCLRVNCADALLRELSCLPVFPLIIFFSCLPSQPSLCQPDRFVDFAFPIFRPIVISRKKKEKQTNKQKITFANATGQSRWNSQTVRRECVEARPIELVRVREFCLGEKRKLSGAY